VGRRGEADGEGGRRVPQSQDAQGVAFALWAQAGALRFGGRVPKAIARFQEAKELFETVGYTSGVAYALCGLGGTHRLAGKFDASLAYYQEANELFRMLKDRVGLAYSHCGIGNAYRMF
jgi:tetratricopeptide (TPR) repeat protein